MRLERQYRLLARAFPAEWRRRHGDDLVATLLDGSAEGQRLASLSDAVDVTGRGMQTRVRNVGPAVQVLTLAMAAVLVTSVSSTAGSSPAADVAVVEVAVDTQIESVRSGTGPAQADHDQGDCSRLMFEQNT